MKKDFKNYKVNIFGFTFGLLPMLITLGCILVVAIVFWIASQYTSTFNGYGLMVGLGFFFALILACQLCKERGLPADYPYSLIWWIFPLSIIGARIYYAIFEGMTDLGQILRIWDGGLAIYGGIIGGLIGLIICSLLHKHSILKTTDVIVPVLALGQAFGRIGCIFGNCCYGVEVTNKALQWFPISIFVHGEYHYATNFYEAIFDFILFIVLTILLRKVSIKGINTFAYLVGYGLVRFILETFRDNAQTLFIGDMPVSQLVSVGCVLIGAIGICTLLFVNKRKEENIDN